MPYQLFVRAGTDYEAHEAIRVNEKEGDYVEFDNEDYCLRVAVRIQDYQGHSNSTCAYFEQEEHKYDQISVQMSIVFKTENVNGDDLVWGNDFDEPIRDILPYGFSIGYNIMKWAIDPSIDGDPYADKPYLYGKALTSMNRIHKDDDTNWPGYLQNENLLTGTTSSARSKHFLNETNRKKFEFEPMVQYSFDFYTPYITLGKEFAIKLPGYNLNVEQYCGSQPLRYVLKNNKTKKVYAIFLFDVKRL
jgi:hypothetical protein